MTVDLVEVFPEGGGGTVEGQAETVQVKRHLALLVKVF